MDNKRFEQILGYVKNGKFPSLKNEVLTSSQFSELKSALSEDSDYLKDVKVESSENLENQKIDPPKEKPNGRLLYVKPNPRTKNKG